MKTVLNIIQWQSFSPEITPSKGSVPWFFSFRKQLPQSLQVHTLHSSFSSHSSPVHSALVIQFFNIESYHTPPSQARPGSTGGCWWGPRCSRHTQGTPDQGSLKTLANFHNLINTYVRYRNRRGCQRNVGFAIFERHSLYESLQVHLQPTPKIRRETSKNFIVQMKH